MREYKTSIIIGVIYIILFIFFPIIRTLTAITILFLALQFAFHGIFVLIGERAERLHKKFVETHLATVTALCLYGVSTGIYFLSLKNIL